MEKPVQPDRLICIVLPVSTGHVDRCLFRKWIKIDLTEAQVQTHDGRYCNTPELALQWLLERIEEQVGMKMQGTLMQPLVRHCSVHVL